MSEELLSLKWNNHQSHFVDILTFLREQEIFIDATLACGGKLYPAHKFVLSTCSDYFKQMFTKNPNKHPIVFMKDVSCRDLEALLDFMYNGEVNVPQSSLGSLIKTAEGLQIKGLAVPDDPPISNKREAALLRDRRELKAVRDNSYSPSPKRLRGREKSPPLYSSRSKSPMSLHPSSTAGAATLATAVSTEASVAAADEDSRTSAISDHSSNVVGNSSSTVKPNVNSHLNSEDSASLSDNLSRVSNRDPSPGPSGLHKHIPPQSKEEELDIKQEDVVDLGETDEGDWGGGGDGEGRDESMDDGGGGDSLTSENNAPNFSDVLGPPSDGSLNTSGDPAMRNDGGGVAVMVTPSRSLSDPATTSVQGGFDAHISPDEHLTVAASTYPQSRSGTTTTTSPSTLAMDVPPSVYRFFLESSGSSSGAVCRATIPSNKFCPSPSMSSSVSISNLPITCEGVEEQQQQQHHRPFPCKFCEARFKKKQHLQNHERIHTGEKYVCILCGQGFSRLHILKHHVSRKHNITDGITSPTTSSSSML